MLPGVSIVICCHNSAERLPETLRHLAAQQVAPNIPWEVVVIDNASTDETAKVAEELWQRADISLRVVAEPKPGLSHARIRGVRAASHEIISFVDDDNWVCSKWVETVGEIFADNPTVGVTGGESIAAFTSPPPDWFYSIQGYYAVGKQYPASGDITEKPGTLLWGAGLSFRKTAIEGLFDQGFEFLLSGRTGTHQLAGEDTEMCFALREAGWRLHYDDRLQLHHFIPPGRLTWDYALRLMRGMGHASVLFNLYLIALGRHPFEPEVPAFKKTWLFQMLRCLKELFLMLVRHPMACLLGREGSLEILQFQGGLYHLSALFKLKGRYRSLIWKIRRARWNQPLLNP